MKYCNIFIYWEYYLKEKQFEIKIIDNAGKIEEKIINNELLKKDKVEVDNFKLNEVGEEYNFDFLHIKTRNIKGNNAFYVVDERKVGEIDIDLPVSILQDKEKKDFYYYVYLKSDYFNKFLNQSRTELNLPNKEKDNLITENKIIEKLQEKVNKFLEYEIDILNDKKEEKIIKVLLDEKNNKTTNNKSIHRYYF